MRRVVFLVLVASGWSQARASELWDRGYSVIPAPRRAALEPGDVVIDGSWGVDARRLDAGHIALRALRRDLTGIHALALGSGAAPACVIRLAVQPGALHTGAGPAIDAQGYRLRIADSAVEITGNADAGLFYGVQTFLQLLKRGPDGALRLPRGTIEDWPALELRFLHWDHQQHQDRVETLKRYLDWSARFKANMIGFQLEDKFEFPSHPVIGQPGAFTTAQLREIAAYARERFIQVVPLIQAPAHFSWALKHPEFADLRADGNNYQACLCDPRSYDLLFALYDDVIRATPGVDYLFASTDEVYYAGICARCGKPYNPVNRSLQWVDFVRKANEHLAKRGRRMLIWAEYPLLAQHVPLLPRGIIDGVIGDPQYLAAEKQLGIRQLAYVSMEGVELLFPDHLNYETDTGWKAGRLQDAYERIANGLHWKGDPAGAFGAAWDASGPHNEGFWLGWSAVAQWAWNPRTTPVDQHVAEFMRIYYGANAGGMVEAYRLMQRQARGWERAWDRVPSRVRGPGYGNSFGKGIGTGRRDMTLQPPPLPSLPGLEARPFFKERYAAYLAEARRGLGENERLVALLQEMFPRVDRNRYGLEVMLVLARLIRHHWDLLTGLAEAEDLLVKAAQASRARAPAEAVGNVVEAIRVVSDLETARPRVLAQLRTVFEKSQYPRGRSVNGRKFVDINDDTKDYWAQRRTDLSYMTAPEESIHLASWLRDATAVVRAYAKSHGVPVTGLPERRLEE